MNRSLLLIGVLLAGCSGATVVPIEPDQPKPKATSLPTVSEADAEMAAKRVLIERLRLERSGGFAGRTLTIDVTPAGAYRWTTDGPGPNHLNVGELEQSQLKTLADALKDFGQYKGEYVAKAGTADDFKYVLKYGDKTVTASDASPDLPARFLKLCELVANLVQANR